MSATSRAYQQLSSWSRSILRRRRRRLADKARRSRRGAIEPLEGRLLLTGDPLWPAAAPDRFDQAVEALFAGSGPANVLSPAAETWDGSARVTPAEDSRPAATSHWAGAFAVDAAAKPGPSLLNPELQTLQTLVIVDSGLQDYPQLIDAVTAQVVTGPGVQTVILDAGRDGVRQITAALAERTGLAAIHIFSHGSSGSLTLGNTRLDAATLGGYAGELAAWGRSLSADGDLLLYGCNVAAGASGAAFVDSLAALTGADVAASTDLTGTSRLGGDWDLEYRIGTLDRAVDSSILSSAGYASLLPTDLNCSGLAGPVTFTVLPNNQVAVTGCGPPHPDNTYDDVGSLTGSLGDDTFFISQGAALSGTIDGGGGIDNKITYTKPDNVPRETLNGPVTVNFGVGTAGMALATAVNNGGNDGLRGIHRVIGGDGDDTLTAGATDNHPAAKFEGRAGNDTLTGGRQADELKGDDGNDKLLGKGGHDTLEGGSGADELTGGDGDDTLRGGPDNDVYFFADNWGTDTVDELAGGSTDTLDLSAVTVALDVTISAAGIKVNQNGNNANLVQGPGGNNPPASNLEKVLGGSSANTYTIHQNWGAHFVILNATPGGSTLDFSNIPDTVNLSLQEFVIVVNLGCLG